jgi:RNA polymerase sigma-70 factor (ECF subfamily)
MGGNSTDAEDALSRAMLKAWEKVQKYAGEIANFKAWLTTLTRNLCVDIHRERSRGANRVEDIEGYASFEEQGLVPSEDTPDCARETGEKRIVIRRAIDNLPTRLRETFILHFYRELSYQEIAQQQEISYQNVCKRISQARKILQEELRGYFIEEDGTDTDKSVPPAATESAIGEMSQGNGGVEAGAGETVTLSVAVEEVESVEGEEAQEVARDVQYSESVKVAATSEGKLEVKRDSFRCVEAMLCILQLAPILANSQCRILPAVGKLSKLHFDDVFTRQAQKREFRNYIGGLLGESSRKNLYQMASDAVGVTYHRSSSDIDYFITNVDSTRATAEWIVTTYSQRNWVEVFYREAKGWLGLKEYQVRDYRSLLRHFILVFCAYTFILWHTLTGGLRRRWASKPLNTFAEAIEAFRTAMSFRAS